MKVLVTSASRHGSTAEISAAIARLLASRGLVADIVPAERVSSLEEYDAVVLGSAVYMGRWLEPAKRLATDRRAELKAVPVWLFSSGPTGDPLMPKDEPLDPPEIARLTGAREHRLFGGVLDRNRLSLAEKAIVTMVRARDGDFRPWDEIEGWAAQIASQLLTRTLVS